MGNLPSGTAIEQGLHSQDLQCVVQSLRQLQKVTEGRCKDCLEWPHVLQALSHLLDAQSAHSRDLLRSPDLFHCLSGLVRLPRITVLDHAFQAVLQRNMAISLLTALASNPDPQARGTLLASLKYMLGDQPEAELETMAQEDSEVSARGYGAVLAQKLGRKLQERRYSAQHCGLFPAAWKRLLVCVVPMEQLVCAGGPVSTSLANHPLTQLLREIKNFESQSISFAVFLFHHYLGLCRPGDVLITLLMELGDFLQTNVAKIAIQLATLESTAEEVTWHSGRRIPLRRATWLQGLGDTLYDLITTHRLAPDEDRRVVASAAYSCFQVYARVYRHSEKVIQLVEVAVAPFENLASLFDLPGAAQDLQLSLNCLHTHLLHAQLADRHVVRSFNALCTVLYRLAPYYLDAQQALPPFLVSAAEACVKCFQVLIHQPILMNDASSRTFLLRLLSLLHARFRAELEPALFECIAAICGVWDPELATCIVPFTLEACLQLLSFASLFWAELRATSHAPDSVAALFALASDLLVAPTAAQPVSRRLLADDASILTTSGVDTQGCATLLGLLDTCNTLISPGCRRPTDLDPLEVPLDFRPPPTQVELLQAMDFVNFTWGSARHRCSIVHLCCVDEASCCQLQLPGAILRQADAHKAALAALARHLHHAVGLIGTKLQRLLRMLHTETAVGPQATVRLVQLFGPLHSSHLMCYLEASIFVGGPTLFVPVAPPLASPPSPTAHVATATGATATTTAAVGRPGTVSGAAVHQQAVQQLREEVRQLTAENQRLLQRQNDAAQFEALSEALTCSICLDNFMPREPCALHCGHIFCYPCVAPLLNSVCPLCRTPLANTPVVKLKSFNLG
eukprot:EG_transcript_2981